MPARLPKRQHAKKRAWFWAALLPLIIVSGVLVNWIFLAGQLFAAPLAGSSQPGHNTFQQFQQAGQPGKNKGQFRRPGHDPGAQKPDTSGKTNKPLPSAEPAKMKDMTFVLDGSFIVNRPRMKPSSQPARIQGTGIPAGTTPFVITGSDGRLEVDLPRNSLDLSLATLADGSAPVGQLFLRVHQLFGHYIEEESILGAYQIQVIDSQGNVVQGVKLLRPATIVYHYQKWELQDLDIDPALVRLVQSGIASPASTPTPSLTPPPTSTPPASPTPGPTPAAPPSSPSGLLAPLSSTGPTPAPSSTSVPMTDDATNQTFTAQTTDLAATQTVASPPDLALPAHPDLFETSGNSGQYTYSYPIAVASGPGGFAPQLALNYSSQSTNERHSPMAPAGDEGEGFSLSLGSITKAQYPSTSTGGSATWYFLNGVDGVSDRLVPDPDGQSTWYTTQHISGLKIQWTGDHWRVWGKDGTFYEVGGTSDSTQTTPNSGTYEWDVSKILAPYNDDNGQVRTMFISYYQDIPSSGRVRDSGIKQIQYGSASTTGATSLSVVSGTVDFSYLAQSTQSPWATAYSSSYYSACKAPATTTLRCDTPLDYPNGLPASSAKSTLSLVSIKSYVGSDSSSSNLAYSYALSYHDTPFSACTDPLTGLTAYCAGNHLLTSITPTRYVQGVGYPQKPVVLSYTALQDHYHDPNMPSSSSPYIVETNWNYLNTYQDQRTGEGAAITYATAHANMEGTPYVTNSQGQVVDDRFDPFYCDNQANNSDTSKRCTGSYAGPDHDTWSEQVVTQIAALGTDSSGNPTVATTKYQYALGAISQSRDPINCHPISGSGVPQQEAECVTDSWSPGYNGTSTPDHDADWQDFYHAEFRGFNIVYITSWSNDLTVDYYFSSDGWWTPTSNGPNYNDGQLYQEDSYQGPNETPSALLKETLNYYTGTGNTPNGNPYSGVNACNGNLNAIYNPCVQAPLETRTIFYEGNGGSSNAPWVDTKYTYDDLNSQGYTYTTDYNNLTQEVISGSNLSSTVYPITKKWKYTPDDGTNSNGVYYHDVDKVTHSEIDDNSGHVWQCQDTIYDEGAPSGVPTPDAGFATTVTSYSTCGNASTAVTSYTGYDQYGNVVATVDPLGVANPSLYGSKGCSASGVVDLSASWTAGRFTSCTTYDTGKTAGLPVTQTNALGQATNVSYDYTSGALLTSSQDPNGQTTSYSESYDSSGNETINASQPGESGSYTTRQVENSTCTSSSTLPCYEIDSNSSLYPGAVSRTFYDSQGRAVETRTPGPTPGDDTVVMFVYNDQNHTMWQSEPFQVADGSGWIDPTGARDLNGNAPAGTTTFYDALGRVIATQDLTFGSSQEPGSACSTVLSGNYTSCTNYSFGQAVGDGNYYSLTTSVDPNGHVTQSFADALGNVRYTQTNSGVSGGTLTVQQQTQTQYNALGKPTLVAVIDEQPQSGESPTGVTTTMTYDDQGRLLTEVDPDQGTFTYSYDPDGHVISVVQTSGSNSRTLGMNYDLLGRVGCEQTAAPTSITWNGACTAGNSLVQNTYDTTVLGTQGSTDFPIGHLTQSVATTYYPDNTSATVTQQYQTDQRGRTTNEQIQLGLPSGWNVTSALPIYQLALLYNDANQVTTTSTNAGGNGYTFTQVYDSGNGVVQGLSNNGSSTANLAQLSYTERTQIGSITLFNGASSSPVALAREGFCHDADMRPTCAETDWLPGSGNSGLILNQGWTYDNAGNRTGTDANFQSTTVAGQSGVGGEDTQDFCYDEQNRLVWAGNIGTEPGVGNGTCGSLSMKNGLTGANYTAPYTYTNLGQIWTGPVNGQGSAQQYLYCNSQPHELTGIYPTGTTCSNKGSATATYSAAYDPWGNETTRTYNNVTATLSYDQLNHLVEYNASSSGQEWYVYDASGNRVLKRSTSGGITTLAASVFGLEEYHYSGEGVLSSQLHYYSLAGYLIGAFDGTNTTFYLTDALGSVLLSLSASAVQGEQIYGPYGNQRYTVGTMGTDKGYTGQFHDSVTGLDYYNARYYDPVAGVFLSPDHVQGNAQGMDAYAYVGGNPETKTDPTGERIVDPGPSGPGQGGCPSGEELVSGGCAPDPGSGGPPQGCPSGGKNSAGASNCAGTTTETQCPDGFSGPDCLGNKGTDCFGLTQPRCNQAQKAYRDAKNAENAFQGFANIFGSLPFIIASILGNLLTFILGPIWGGIIGGILDGLALLARLASDIASGFKTEADQEDLRAGQGLAYFTLANLEAQGQQILGMVGLEGKESVVAGWGLILTSIAAGNGINMWGPQLLGLGKDLLKGGVTTGIVTMIVAAAGSMIMYNIASSYITQEENDAMR